MSVSINTAPFSGDQTESVNCGAIVEVSKHYTLSHQASYIESVHCMVAHTRLTLPRVLYTQAISRELMFDFTVISRRQNVLSDIRVQMNEVTYMTSCENDLKTGFTPDN